MARGARPRARSFDVSRSYSYLAYRRPSHSRASAPGARVAATRSQTRAGVPAAWHACAVSPHHRSPSGLPTRAPKPPWDNRVHPARDSPGDNPTSRAVSSRDGARAGDQQLAEHRVQYAAGVAGVNLPIGLFDLLASTAHADREFVTAGATAEGRFENWLPGQDSNLRPSD